MKLLIRFSIVLVLLATLVLTGCPRPRSSKKTDKSNSGIIGQKTNEIGEFDPEKGAKVSDGKMKSTNPLNPLAPLNAYQPVVEKLMKMQVQHALELYRATSGRYPKDFDEFMEKVAKPNRMNFPKLPGNWVYQYDVENHQLVVVEGEKKEDE